MKNLNDLKPGDSGRIIAVAAPESIRQRLMDLGLFEGALVMMLSPAPLGDPIRVRVLDTVLALRRNEAELIFIGDVVRGVPERHRHRFGRKS